MPISLNQILNTFYHRHALGQVPLQIPDLRVGYTVGVQTKADASSGKIRGQYFEGIVIAMQKKHGTIAGITVRKFYKKDAVTRKFLFMNDDVASISVVKSTRARRAKLYKWSYRQKV